MPAKFNRLGQVQRVGEPGGLGRAAFPAEVAGLAVRAQRGLDDAGLAPRKVRLAGRGVDGLHQLRSQFGREFGFAGVDHAVLERPVHVLAVRVEHLDVEDAFHTPLFRILSPVSHTPLANAVWIRSSPSRKRSVAHPAAAT